jgi:hypothetical protein
MGGRRVKSGPRKGQWQRYRKPARKQQRRRARYPAEYLAVPFAAAWLGGRWMVRKARRKPPPPPKQLPVRRPVRAPAAKTATAPVPAAKPAPPQPQKKVRLHDFQRGPTIMNHISAASEGIAQHIGSWEPENAKDLDGFLAALPELFDTLGGSLRSVAGRLDGLPIHRSVIERLHDIAATIGGMSDFSGEAHATHRAQHEKELERIENPRPQEEFWDVSRQD